MTLKDNNNCINIYIKVMKLTSFGWLNKIKEILRLVVDFSILK